MEITREQVLNVASLARLFLTDEEVELYRTQLAAILQQAEILQGFDSEALPPLAGIPSASNVVRQDIPTPSLSRADALHNAPSVTDSHFVVQAVLEDGQTPPAAPA
ncbi:MAG: Glutamyl-tRNA(Gln) amidotransferase subunit C [Chloroflexi bacterium ADurb.Bin180]|nr:MAG: Glutamyl-tRNA(Gln) amidotransferase subunit C [Chloroflexi bacterium ADurb.Bin180]HNR97009.1 Asp-tRNA(Asn)/Glu-tRNA(Gln) amidotransferase subunit GatC [Anaerolineae bacterium]HNT06050.1 Asp-tRNA(Asn)/Glu-tRNA(Gln) amidotransferase subunit GatC [Anaerolineae bacterium]